MTTTTTSAEDPMGVAPVVGLPTQDDDLERRTDLRAIPHAWAYPPAEMVAQLPKAGTTLDYMGHADVTLALIDVDPEWTLELGWDCTAGPIDPFAMGPGTLLAKLTVLGVTRPCVGTIEARKVDTESALKELLGDAIRNGAMRFGIATGLWSKAQRSGHDPDEQTGRRMQRPEPWTVPMMKAKAMELAGGDRDLAAEVYDLVVPVVDADHKFAPDIVAGHVADMQELIDRRRAQESHPDPAAEGEREAAHQDGAS